MFCETNTLNKNYIFFTKNTALKLITIVNNFTLKVSDLKYYYYYSKVLLFEMWKQKQIILFEKRFCVTFDGVHTWLFAKA